MICRYLPPMAADLNYLPFASKGSSLQLSTVIHCKNLLTSVLCRRLLQRANNAEHFGAPRYLFSRVAHFTHSPPFTSKGRSPVFLHHLL